MIDQLINNMQELVHQKAVNRVRVYGHDGNPLCLESTDWLFQIDHIRVGRFRYSLYELQAFKILDGTLSLYLLADCS